MSLSFIYIFTKHFKKINFTFLIIFNTFNIIENEAIFDK
jgi:hypothetical protein